MTGRIVHTFTTTGFSPSGATEGGKTLVIRSAGTFSVDARVSRDGGSVFDVVETFTSPTVQNFEWLGDPGLIVFECTAIAGGDMDLEFK